MSTALSLEGLVSPEAVKDLSTQQKRALAWDIIDGHTPSKGFSRKKLVPLHSAIMSILSAPGSVEELHGNIKKVFTESEPSRCTSRIASGG